MGGDQHARLFPNALFRITAVALRERDFSCNYSSQPSAPAGRCRAATRVCMVTTYESTLGRLVFFNFFLLGDDNSFSYW